jgi:hypothetical protein
VTNEQLQRVEKRFALSLPEWYRSRVIDYPVADSELALYDDESSLIRENEELRRDGWYDFHWPSEFFVIGETGCGDSFFIVPSTDDRRIFIADHEGGPEPAMQNLDEMVAAENVELHVAEWREGLEEAEHMAERRRNKKWWEFWK